MRMCVFLSVCLKGSSNNLLGTRLFLSNLLEVIEEQDISNSNHKTDPFLRGGSKTER